jgi:hypothetical protein
VHLDAGYDSSTTRALLAERGLHGEIAGISPTRSSRCVASSAAPGPLIAGTPDPPDVHDQHINSRDLYAKFWNPQGYRRLGRKGDIVQFDLNVLYSLRHG